MPENSEPKVVNIDPASERADAIASIMNEAVALVLSEFGIDLAGFALVAWDMQGEVKSVYMAQHGVVGRCIMPAHVHDALQRHVTVELIEENKTSESVPRLRLPCSRADRGASHGSSSGSASPGSTCCYRRRSL